MQGDDVWKCEKKSNDPEDPEDPKDPKDPCVKQPWQICGDWHGKYKNCKCTDGYECKDLVRQMVAAVCYLSDR